ncbi:NGG1p interacting factor 3 protein, NIF3 [Endozoicomonas numazuensis]|uniref:NGG1p interacting factor 3 protein, NIF3 n=1 Tax=Endozoicomonas numazuensis TaxID=1137799 RepID=A0A081NLX4_9GAMM|nr:NGG1p interacting factor 3 protein, NIF3 [Endozoicomonas numazuensis]KEQ19447.1 NGG1p interacting factor 3 protein, NIF3 [Endozoicomonas numazuensis]
MYKISVFIPESHLEAVKTAMFEAGAGRYDGCYDCCCWQTAGTGQFRPLQDSTPFLGQQGCIEQVKEFRVEMICKPQFLKATIAALKKSHPYEVPAFEYWQINIQ